MKEIILWQGTIREVDPPEFSRPLLWLDCDYDSGHLIYDGKVTDKETNSHLLVLEHGYKQSFEIGRRFTFSIKLYESHEDWAWDIHSSLVIGSIVATVDKWGVNFIDIKATESSGLICSHDGNVGLTLEKDAILGSLGQTVQLFLKVE